MAERVFLTGATGFVGGHVARALLEAGYQVRALVRRSAGLPPVAAANLRGCEVVEGDLERPGQLVEPLRGCRSLIHVAARYSFTPGDRAAMRRVNVLGTAGLLEAARLAGVERAVVTSSSAAVGEARAGRPATEEDWPVDGDASAYHASKVEQERVALSAQLPVCTVLPTAPIGPGDWKPTPTGRLVLDFVRGRMRLRPPRGPGSRVGGMNLVPVEDVARGHVLALERGRPGERYLLGGVNLTLDQVWELLARASGRPLPRWHVPYPVALVAALADEARCRWLGGVPRVPLEGVRMSRHVMHVSSERAARELGWRAGGIEEAALRAVRWYRDRGSAG
ncbi:MAG TPA: NAD-dependent epimerase/dehydratase family protein [Candidatus Dormibacteraeota bacterium]|nr:NAD-dependent epimerase/dehydratase family protein [Candidatus Dormibacteraeota bacterium]